MSRDATPADVVDGKARWCLIRGDAVVWMRLLAFTYGQFARAILCDPPYHLTQASRGGSPRNNDLDTPFGRTRLGSKGFLGRTWDGGDVAHRIETWEAALLCCKPGAYLVAAHGTRTYHRLVCAVEDAGWSVHDMIGWIGSGGMAKTGDVSKRIDKMHGAEREFVCDNPNARPNRVGVRTMLENPQTAGGPITAPATDDARAWEGYSESLAPSIEPMVLARKPFRGSTARNLLANGCGAMNIDAARIGVGTGGDRDGEESAERRYSDAGATDFAMKPGPRGGDAKGRWPKNVGVIHSDGCRRVGTKRVKSSDRVGHEGKKLERDGVFAESGIDNVHSSVTHGDADGLETIESWECEEGCAVLALDRQAGYRHAAGNLGGTARKSMGYHGSDSVTTLPAGYADDGNVSRFFYAAKAASSERWTLVVCACGRRAMRRTAAKLVTEVRGKVTFCIHCNTPAEIVSHATVKPQMLLGWVAKLIVPPKAIVLVPFAGSASEMIAVMEAQPDARVIGIELEQDHYDIAVARLEAWDRGDRDADDEPEERAEALAPLGPKQGSLF